MQNGMSALPPKRTFRSAYLVRDNDRAYGHVFTTRPRPDRQGKMELPHVSSARYERQYVELFNSPAALSPFQSWPGYTISASGYDFWKGQAQQF